MAYPPFNPAKHARGFHGRFTGSGNPKLRMGKIGEARRRFMLGQADLRVTEALAEQHVARARLEHARKFGLKTEPHERRVRTADIMARSAIETYRRLKG